MIIFTFQLSAQDEKQYEFDHIIKSDAFGDDRKITVYLPPTYYDNTSDKFTVTYVLDGHFDPFVDLVAKTIEYNTYMYNYTPTIVVGIHAKNRGWEFSPPIPGNKYDEEYEGGRAPELQDHLEKEVFPLVDSIYNKTIPFRNILGHSSGGAFVLYTLFGDRKDLFDGYIAISPGIREDSEFILENASKRLGDGEKFSKFLYCSSGTVGEREEIFGGAVHRLDSIIKRNPDNGLIWKKSKFELMDHWTCVGPSINTAMVELTRAFRVDEQMFYDFARNKDKSMTEQLKSFYEDKNTRYGYTEIPIPSYIYQAAWYISVQVDKQRALELYNWGLEHHPKNFRLTNSKGKLLAKMGRKKEARESFEECLLIVEEAKVELGEERYKDRKQYIQDKLDALKKN